MIGNQNKGLGLKLCSTIFQLYRWWSVLLVEETADHKLEITRFDLRKESLKSDGHYQHNEQSPLILSELTEHEKTP